MSHHSRKDFSWGSALRDLKSDRAQRPEIRFEPNRGSASVRLAVASGMSAGAWRGLSGKRYQVGVYSVGHSDLTRIHEGSAAVFVATVRDALGQPTIKSIRSYVAGDGRFPLWLDAVVSSLCATEIHVCRILPDAAARTAMMEDLGAVVAQVAAPAQAA